MREEYFGAVGFAKEPSEQRKRWIARVVLAIFLVFIIWLFVTRVVSPPEDTGPSGVSQTELPGPV